MRKINSAIIVCDLWVRYNGRFVLEAINLTVGQGEIVSIVGPNGSGKTTLLNTILGFKDSAKGSVQILGEDPKVARRAGEIGYLPQNAAADGRFPVTAWDTVAMARFARNSIFYRRDKFDNQKIHEALEKVEMSDLSDQHFGSLSGGQQQRVLIARALALEPRILLLDEPSTGLDLVAQDSFYSLLQTLRNEHNLAILMVSHDIGAVSGVVDRIACLNRRIHFHGPAGDCIPSEALEKVFGANVKFVLHDKHCDTCEQDS